MSRFSPPPGTSDITPAEVAEWRFLENTARDVFELYGYGEIRTPVFEYTEVFERGLGDQTEVVQKEMYTFEDRGGRSLTLRPEGTAGVMRSLAETDVMNGVEQRVFYIGPMFRGERPAAGRRRQFHQIGAENVGRAHPRLDAEVIAMYTHYLEKVGITGTKLLINTRGEQRDRDAGAQLLREYFAPVIAQMCPDCQQRFQKNIWRILDCKCKECQDLINNAPNVTTAFTDETKLYFKDVCDCLDALGVDYQIAPRLVRGLDYYAHTVFEWVHDGLGAQSAVAGGGRYEIHLQGSNKPVIGVGFASGIERLIMIREALQCKRAEKNTPAPVILIPLGEAAEKTLWNTLSDLRNAGIPAHMEPESGKSMKSQMRTANRLTASYAVICGDAEIENKQFVIKNMANSEQITCPSDALIAHLQSCIFQTNK